MTRNAWRHVIVVFLAFVGGGITCMTESSATIKDFVRHGLLATGPVLAALRMTLEQGEEPKIKQQGAGQ